MSARQLVQRIQAQDAAFRRAAFGLGISAAQYDAFRKVIATQHNLTPAPKQLDAVAKIPRPGTGPINVRLHVTRTGVTGLSAVVDSKNGNIVTVGITAAGDELWVVRRKARAVQIASGNNTFPTPPALPSPPPPATPTPSPTASPTPHRFPTPPTLARNPSEHFVVADYVVAGKVYNEFSPGNPDPYAIRAAAEFSLFGLPWMLEGDYRSYSYRHNSGITQSEFASSFDGNPCPHGGFTGPLDPVTGVQGCVTVIGAYGQVPVASFTARDTDFDGRFALKIAEPRIYIGVGYLHREENYGYPKQNGFGFGAEKLPDLDRPFSVYGSVWYYPSISGNFTLPAGAPPALAGKTDKLRQSFLKYQIGGTLNLGNSALFLDAGFHGDTIRGKNLSPSDASHAGGYVGLGTKF